MTFSIMNPRKTPITAADKTERITGLYFFLDIDRSSGRDESPLENVRVSASTLDSSSTAACSFKADFLDVLLHDNVLFLPATFTVNDFFSPTSSHRFAR